MAAISKETVVKAKGADGIVQRTCAEGKRPKTLGPLRGAEGLSEGREPMETN